MTAPDAAPSGLVCLPAVLDAQAAAPLMQALLDQKGRDVRLDGAGVQRLGGQCLQVLLAAQAAWRSDSATLTITSPSPDFQAALVLLGIGPSSPLLQQEQHP